MARPFVLGETICSAGNEAEPTLPFFSDLDDFLVTNRIRSRLLSFARILSHVIRKRILLTAHCQRIFARESPSRTRRGGRREDISPLISPFTIVDLEEESTTAG